MLKITPNEIANVSETKTMPLVMLVDDSEINNFVNTNILKRYEFSDRIITYENSQEAFEYLQNAEEQGLELPAIIFLDLNMPIMDGRMFVEKFENLPQIVRSACKIIILSSSANPHDRVSMLNNKNVFDYFSPPLIKSNLDQLSTTLRKYTLSMSAKKPESNLLFGISSPGQSILQYMQLRSA